MNVQVFVAIPFPLHIRTLLISSFVTLFLALSPGRASGDDIPSGAGSNGVRSASRPDARGMLEPRLAATATRDALRRESPKGSNKQRQTFSLGSLSAEERVLITLFALDRLKKGAGDGAFYPVSAQAPARSMNAELRTSGR